jgi:hypothetical protein
MNKLLVLTALVCLFGMSFADHHHYEDNKADPARDCPDTNTSVGLYNLRQGEFACAPSKKGHYFMVCDNTKIVTTLCPAGLVFNIKRSMCDWGANKDCYLPPRDACPNSDTSKGKKNLIHSQWACGDDKGATFKRCWGGVVYNWTCPVGTAFNVVLGKCQWPKNMDCSVPDLSQYYE